MTTNRKSRGWYALLLLLLIGPLAYSAPVAFRPAGNSIGRDWSLVTAAINTSLGSCDVINITDRAGCTIKLPASVTGLVFYGMESADDASPAVIRVATDISSGLTPGQWIDFPPEVFAHGYIKILSVGASGNAKIGGKS